MLQILPYIGLLLLIAGAALWFYRQGEKSEKLDTAKGVENEEKKLLDANQKANSFKDKLDSDPAFASRMSSLIDKIP